MENIALEYRLKRAELRVAQGYEHIKRQREVLADLTRYGDTEAAKNASELLDHSENMQASRVIDCGRIVEELRRLNKS